MRNLLTLTAMIALLSACSPPAAERATPDAEKVTPRVTETERTGVDSPTDLNPMQAQSRIDDVTIGTAVDAAGAIAADTTADNFAPGATVYLSMEVGDTPAGSAIKVVWFGPNDVRISDEVKSVPTGATHVSFEASTTGWAVGDYHAEVWIGDENVATEHFDIEVPDNNGV